MDTEIVKYEEQSALWNGVAGEAWVDQQDLLDRMFRGLEELLVDEAVAFGGDSILDVGCGTGNTTLAIARAVGPRVNCVGIDVSGPMLGTGQAASHPLPAVR